MAIQPGDDNVFAGSHVDRLGHLRKDTAWLREQLDDTNTRFVVVWNDRSLISRDTPRNAVLLDKTALAGLPSLSNEPILLGRVLGKTCFAVDVGKGDREQPPDAPGEFVSLRASAMLLPAAESSLLAYAQGMVLWDRRHRYCGRCGSATTSRDAGHVRACPTDACGQQWFPRIDPAIIVLVSDGDRALLGRQAIWPKGVYSTIAGFAEPGESLEDAVVREVHEETGVVVDSVRYHSSQPWPFPSSLMIGYMATAAQTEITLIDKELEDARWFTRDELVASQSDAGPRPPSTISIAYRLVSTWFDDGVQGRLDAALAARRKS